MGRKIIVGNQSRRIVVGYPYKVVVCVCVFGGRSSPRQSYLSNIGSGKLRYPNLQFLLPQGKPSHLLPMIVYTPISAVLY